MTDDCSRLIELVFVSANVLANDWCAQHCKGHWHTVQRYLRSTLGLRKLVTSEKLAA
jgi:hypothetical protein